MKLLVDMNLSPQWIGFLDQAKIEAIHWSAVGPAIASDADIMTFEDGALLTIDPKRIRILPLHSQK